MHGGRDLKEGSIASMWRLNLSSIHSLMEDDGNFNQIAEWELVQTTGRGPGRISHHTVSVRPSKEVVFYGGLKGEDSNNEIFLFNPNTNAWLSVNPSVSILITSLTPRVSRQHLFCEADQLSTTSLTFFPSFILIEPISGGATS